MPGLRGIAHAEATVISEDTWIHRFVSLGVRPFVNTALTPNHLTTLRLVTGLIAAGFYAAGGDPWIYYGSVLFILSMLLDRADGVLARLSGKTSTWGHKYDLVCDVVSNAALFFGLGFGLPGAVLGGYAIWLGVVAGAGIVGVFVVVLYVERQRGVGTAILKSFAGVDPDDLLIVVPIAAMFGGGAWILLAAAIGTPVALVIFVWRFREPARPV